MFVLSACFLTVFSQTEWPMPYNAEKKLFIYEEVVQVSNVTKDELFNRALDWVKNFFLAGANIITEKDAVNGIIKLKYRITVFKMEKKTKVVDVVVDYNIEIHVKDGKYKYIIHNFRNFQGSTSPGIEIWTNPAKCEKELAIERYTSLNTEIQALIENMKKFMISGNAKSNQDW